MLSYLPGGHPWWRTTGIEYSWSVWAWSQDIPIEKSQSNYVCFYIYLVEQAQNNKFVYKMGFYNQPKKDARKDALKNNNLGWFKETWAKNHRNNPII
jgi:hypothetical protein